MGPVDCFFFVTSGLLCGAGGRAGERGQQRPGQTRSEFFIGGCLYLAGRRDFILFTGIAFGSDRQRSADGNVDTDLYRYWIHNRVWLLDSLFGWNRSGSGQVIAWN